MSRVALALMPLSLLAGFIGTALVRHGYPQVGLILTFAAGIAIGIGAMHEEGPS